MLYKLELVFEYVRIFFFTKIYIYKSEKILHVVISLIRYFAQCFFFLHVPSLFIFTGHFRICIILNSRWYGFRFEFNNFTIVKYIYIYINGNINSVDFSFSYYRNKYLYMIYNISIVRGRKNWLKLLLLFLILFLSIK